MKNIQTIATITEYNKIALQQTYHPLISVIDFSKIDYSQAKRLEKPDIQALQIRFYAIFLKEDKHCDIRYGRNYYDYQESTLVFIGPQQVVSIEEDGEDYIPKGHVLLFHPDLLRGTPLDRHIKDFTFFSYLVFEALHLSQEEKQIVLECFNKIDYELKHGMDKHSKKLTVFNIELLLNYCVRFYDRQFITREQVNSSILDRFDRLINEYLDSDQPQTIGLPRVSHFAGALHLSANYLGDLIRKETGSSAQEYIQTKLIEAAKEKIYDPKQSIAGIAYELGFKYPQHFTRLFKQKVGVTHHSIFYCRQKGLYPADFFALLKLATTYG